MPSHESLFVGGTLVPSRTLLLLNPLEHGRLAIVTGPAGYGKTELIRAWLNEQQDRIANTATVVLFRDEPTWDPTPLRAYFEEHADDPQPHYALVDNYDSLVDQSYVTQLLDIAEHYKNARIILVGRTRPAFPLANLAMRGLLVDIGPEQLKLTREEVTEAVRRAGEADPSAIDILMHEFRGWPTAIELVSQRPLTWDAISAITHIVDGYLDEEVLNEVSEEDIQFLADLAPLASLNPASASFMTGRGDAIAHLTQLAAKGIPMTWASANTIEISPALRHFLERRTQETDPARAVAQRRKAVTWTDRHVDGVEAVRQAASAQDTDMVYDLITAQFANRFIGDIAELERILHETGPTLPENFQLPLMRLVVRMLRSPGSVPTTALRALRHEIPDDASPSAMSRFYASSLVALRQRGEDRDPELLAECLAFCESDAVLQLKPMDEALLMVNYGYQLCVNDHLREGILALEKAATAAHLASMDWCAQMSLGLMAWFTGFRGSMATLRRAAEESTALGEQNHDNHRVTRGMAHLALASAAIETGDAVEARRQFAIYRDELVGPPLMTTELCATQIDAMIQTLDDHPAAAQTLVQQELTTDNPVPLFHRMALMALLFNAYLDSNKLDLAQKELEAMKALPLTESRPTLWTYDLRLLMARGETSKAFDVSRAYLADPAGMSQQKVRLYLFMINGVSASTLGHNEEALSAFQQAGALAQRLGLDTPAARHTMIASSLHHEKVDLTPAETNVVAQLSTDKTLAEIADALFISHNTLKTHLRRIYKKLGVPGRAGAVERARVLGIPLN